jgi:hypothetical protein
VCAISGESTNLIVCKYLRCELKITLASVNFRFDIYHRFQVVYIFHGAQLTHQSRVQQDNFRLFLPLADGLKLIFYSVVCFRELYFYSSLMFDG